MKKLILLVILLLVACSPEISASAPPPPPEVAPENENFYCTIPESDNGLAWANGSRVCYDTQVYELTVNVLGDLASNQTTSGEISGGSYGSYGSVSGRIWTDGKGVLPVMIVSMNIAATWIDLTQPYLLKTTDLKVMGVPAGSRITVICQHDVEALSPSFTGQTFTRNRVTDELDNCRMKTGNYSLSQ